MTQYNKKPRDVRGVFTMYLVYQNGFASPNKPKYCEAPPQIEALGSICFAHPKNKPNNDRT